MDQLQGHLPVSSQEGLLHRIANRIRKSLELKEILDAMVDEVRDYLEVDRVKVYQFEPDQSGVVISESLNPKNLPSLLGLHFPADDIPPYARELFLKARQRSVVDVTNVKIGISPLDNPETGENNDENNIRYRPLDPCHAEYLKAMGVKSSVVVPIVLTELSTAKKQLSSSNSSTQLWGLLACHHSQSRYVTEEELKFIQAVVDQVGVTIAQSVLLDRVRSQAKQEANINRVTQLLYTTPKVKLQAALDEAVATFNGSGGRLYLLADENQATELYTSGEQPDFLDKEQSRVIEENYLWKNFLRSVIEPHADSTGYKPWSVQWMRSVYQLGNYQEEVDNHPHLWTIDDIYREPLFRSLSPFFQCTSVRSIVIIPLHYGNHLVACLTIFRDGVDTEILWAGFHNPDTRQLIPRRSFETWKQEKKAQAQAWREEDIKYAEALGERFSTAIKQYRLYQQVQALNSNLEQQVQERTEQLQQKTEQLQFSNLELENLITRQEALAGIVGKIRESLNIEEIFRITTKELSQILDVDRVAVYKFNSDWGGKFVADFESLTLQSLDVGELGVNTVWNDTYLQETQGGRYRQGEVFAIDDIYQQNFSQCHLDIYEQFQIKAFIVVPIFVGHKDLWGLLAIYQHQKSRYWKTSEVDFASQIAAQLGVALQHSTLLTYNRQQAKELKKSNAELQRGVEQQETLSSIVAKIRESLDIYEIFQIATKELTQVLGVDRASVYRFNSDWGGEFVADFECITPKWADIGNLGVDTVWDDTYLQETQGGRYRNGKISVVNDVYQEGFSQCHLDFYEQYQIKAFIIVPIFVEQNLWGLLAVYQHQEVRNWETSEVEFISQIGAQLGVATQHSSLLTYTRQQAKELKKSNTELQRGFERQKAISSIVAKIRSSLDMEIIFSTTTEEIKKLLQVDRAVIYRFNPDWSGEFIAESVVPAYNSLMKMQWQENKIRYYASECGVKKLSLASDSHLMETQGGSFAKGTVFSIRNDIYAAGFSDCHLELLESYNARAYVIISIYQKEKLWGLLAAYQNDAPREWQDFEVQFLEQISEQMSVALQQSYLLKQVKSQTEQLKQTLADLQETQTQLVQTEKMSSLGQLVAGIAHEINNPVNFIHANLVHLQEYSNNLLKVLSSYQEYCPEPSSELQDLIEETDTEYIAEDLPKLCSSLSVGTKRIQSIVSSLSNFSRLDEAEMKPVDIHDGIEGTLMILQHRLKTSNSKVNINIVKEYGELPLVDCYAGQLNQVFMNLLSNAIDELQSLKPASEEENTKTITIATQCIENNWVKISIKDDGNGIPPEISDKLFDPFFTTKSVGKGTGLGLSISYKIIGKHGGKLYCNSKVGEGAEFIIELSVNSMVYN